MIILQVYTKEDGVRTGGWMFPGGWVSAVLQLGGQQLVGDTRGRVWVYAGGRGSLVSTHQVFTSAPVASIQVTSYRSFQPVFVILCYLQGTREVVMVASYSKMVIWSRDSLATVSSGGKIDELQVLTTDSF